MALAIREIFNPKAWEKRVFVFLIATLTLVVFGPFGTYASLPLSDRFVYWTILMIGIGAFIILAVSVMLASDNLGRTPPFLRILIGCMIGAVPGTAILIFVNEVYRPEAVAQFNLFLKWAQVTAIGFAISAIEFLNWGMPTDADTARPSTTFHKRLPPDIGPDIISLSMQDHYASVTTAEGTAMVLVRLRDAVAELDGLQGVQTHRSHWVAARHIVRLERSGSKHLVHLSDGRTLPVSATYLDDVRAAASGT